MARPPLIESIRQRAGGPGVAVTITVVCFVVLASSGVIGLLIATPWLFPSLGPTVMVMLGSPRDPSARPLNAMIGHGVGIAVGVGCLFLFGEAGHPSAPVAGLTWGYVLAGATSVALTALVLDMLERPHPPAGATTLIISLGIIATPWASRRWPGLSSSRSR